MRRKTLLQVSNQCGKIEARGVRPKLDTVEHVAQSLPTPEKQSQPKGFRCFELEDSRLGCCRG